MLFEMLPIVLNVAMEKIKVNTRKREELVDVTREVRAAVANSGVADGIVTLYVPHTTAAITVNEGADPDVALDVIDGLADIAPYNSGWRHVEGNADSHIKSSLVSPSITLLIENGDVILGTWQKIFFCEFDGPRTRTLMLKVLKT